MSLPNFNLNVAYVALCSETGAVPPTLASCCSITAGCPHLMPLRSCTENSYLASYSRRDLRDFHGSPYSLAYLVSEVDLVQFLVGCLAIPMAEDLTVAVPFSNGCIGGVRNLNG